MNVSRYVIGMAVLLSLSLVSCSGQKKTDLAAVRKIVEAREAKYAAAYNRQDAAAIAALHTEDAIVMPPNRKMVKGPQGVQAMTEEDFQMGVGNLVLTTLSVDGSGDLVYEIGKYSASIQVSGQPAMQDSGKYLAVWEKQADGNWLIQADIWNSSLPMPGQ